jgi:hypothetical protein
MVLLVVQQLHGQHLQQHHEDNVQQCMNAFFLQRCIRLSHMASTSPVPQQMTENTHQERQGRVHVITSVSGPAGSAAASSQASAQHQERQGAAIE